jgi:phosphatidate cytidylyltransferase
MKEEFRKRIISSIIIIPLFLLFILKGSIFFLFLLIALFCITSLEWMNMVKNSYLKIIGIIFLIFSFYSTYYLRDKSLEFFLLIIIICVSTDLGGYIFGKLFKGPKLTKISPNKTYSGLLGSFLLSIFNSYIFTTTYISIEFIKNLYLIDLNFFVLVFLVSSASQLGDLIISFFKRSSKMKDTGKIIPGHGGMLDRLDGMIFVFPFLYSIKIIFI